MAVKGKTKNLTRREQTEFAIFYETFSEVNFDKEIYSDPESSEKIIIDGESYEKQALIQNLYKTGIKDVEEYISRKLFSLVATSRYPFLQKDFEPEIDFK